MDLSLLKHGGMQVIQLRRDLRLVNPSRQATQTLKLVGLRKLFQVFHDQQEALASFQ